MNAFRVARAARPAFNAFRTVQRRGYADVAADKIQLSLALPHQVRSRMLECWESLFGRGE
jgi:F-type H+-transporting ATPase subunit delta